MSVFIPLLYLGGLIVLISGLQPRIGMIHQRMLRHIESLRMSVYTGDIQKTFYLTKDTDDLLCFFIRQTMYEGKDCRSCLSLLEKVLLPMTLFYQTNTDLLRIIRFRSLMILGGALGGRLMIQLFVVPGAFAPEETWQDFFLLGISFLVVCFSLFHFNCQLPCAWLGESSPSYLSKMWLRGLFRGTCDLSLDLGKALDLLKEKELISGACLQQERQQVLEQWGQKKNREDHYQQQKLTDLCPVYELLGLGVPAFLILYFPICHALKNIYE